ncbi:PH domain-containing protein [Niabella sp. CC-SYL272]|uniref:PH domain-containing protein n=1 Tax=Niabella agricola TaxID=2891571 RepID=UPI001F291CC7|nr:PH domain-containing protein [Niabella agricola]MCF3109717.1 PH domain-containing protein [Niabella agricola]
MMDFTASYDKATKIITALVGMLMLLVLVSMWMGLKTAGTWFPLLFMVVVSFLSVILPYGFSITKYQMNQEELIICRPMGNKKIALTSIASAAIIDPKLLRWSWRIFGSGGMFGYYGTFGNKHLGTMRWYLTRKDQVILITTITNKKLLLSPDDADAFIQQYNQLRTQAGR